MDDEKPDTSHFRFKAKEIELTDLPSCSCLEPISVQDIHQQNIRADEKRRKTGKGKDTPSPFALPEAPAVPSGFKHREIEALNAPARPDDEESISVPEILLENRVAEERSGWGKLKRWRPRKSKRTRDFLLIMGAIDLSIALVMKYLPSAVTLVYGISAITLATSTLGWVMFVVMDDY